MRCTYYCVSDSFDMDQLLKYLNTKGYEPKIFDQAIHAQDIKDKNTEKNIFCFSYGCIVFWGFIESEELNFIEEIKEYTVGLNEELVVDNSQYLYIDEELKSYINEEEDKIMLSSKDLLIKLSLSYGLSQSVKLVVFEDAVIKTIQKTQHLPVELKERGKTSLSKKQLSQLIGSLFAQRNSINLHSDIMDTPEFFWRRSQYMTYYTTAISYLDINTRLEILNKKLAVIQELYQILSSELNSMHSAKLELIIVWLILFELLIGIAEAWLIFAKGFGAH